VGGSIFECCQKFLQCLERELALLNAIASLKSPNDEFGTSMQKELSSLHATLSELELRIRRCVVFAPTNGGTVTKTAKECIDLIGAMVRSGTGSFDVIISKMNEFNAASRLANAEMLHLQVSARGL
jgi:hypothetical protein